MIKSTISSSDVALGRTYRCVLFYNIVRSWTQKYMKVEYASNGSVRDSGSRLQYDILM